MFIQHVYIYHANVIDFILHFHEFHIYVKINVHTNNDMCSCANIQCKYTSKIKRDEKHITTVCVSHECRREKKIGTPTTAKVFEQKKKKSRKKSI